jgi:E3 ubiquitin-protein ligase HECTD2
MAPWLSRRGSQPNNSSNLSNSDLITRIHNTALHTPTTLPALYSTNLQATSNGNGNGNRFELSFSNTNGDSSSDESDLHPSRPSSSRPQRPPHTRSMSQPFPSLFSSKKKRQNSVGAPPPDLGFVDDDAVMPRQAPKSHARSPSHNGNGPAGSKDFATGNCMTCGSLVRWPRELKVFKCTICTTVNDLEPLSADHDGSKPRRDASHGPSQSNTPRGRPVESSGGLRLTEMQLRMSPSNRQSDLSTNRYSLILPRGYIQSPIPQPSHHQNLLCRANYRSAIGCKLLVATLRR